MQLRRFITAGVALALVGSTGLVLSGLTPTAAGEPPGNGVNPIEGGQEVGVGAGHPGTERTVDVTAHSGSGSSGPNNLCIDGVAGEWQQWGSEGWHASFPAPSRPPGVSPDATFWFLHCPQLASLEAPGIDRAGWSVDGPPEPPPTAADLVLPAWAYVKGLLENPEITLSPPLTTRSVINIPTFVAIGNPQPSTTYTAARDGVEVWIAVIPTVTLNPGEPDGAAVPCDDDGTAFVPDAGTPEAQAEGGCAHTYVHQSQPAWGGNVTITWNVTWGSNQAGQNGDFSDDVAPGVTPFDRIVDEVHGFVTNE